MRYFDRDDSGYKKFRLTLLLSIAATVGYFVYTGSKTESSVPYATHFAPLNTVEQIDRPNSEGLLESYLVDTFTGAEHPLYRLETGLVLGDETYRFESISAEVREQLSMQEFDNYSIESKIEAFDILSEEFKQALRGEENDDTR